MKVNKSSIKSLKAYFENITEIKFSDEYVRNFLENCSKGDIEYIKNSSFHKMDNLNFNSMESFYRENFVVNLISDFLGDYDYPFSVLKMYLSDFKNIDELNDHVFLKENKPSPIDLLSKYRTLTFIINKGKHTEKLVCKGEKAYLKEIHDMFSEKYKDCILISYLNH